MADLSIAYHHQCKSNTEMTAKGSNGETYHLHCSRGTWHCSCKSFQYRGSCKHVAHAVDNGCHWHSNYDGGEPVLENGEKKCPNCGNDVEVVRVGI